MGAGVEHWRVVGLYGLSRCRVDQSKVILTIAYAEQRMLKNLLRRKFPNLNPVQERTLAEASDRERGPRHLLNVVILLKSLQAYNGHAK